MTISVVFIIAVLFVLLIAPPALSQAANESANFFGFFGDLIIDRIKAGRALKASVEDAQKISYQQDAAGNDCGKTVASQPAPTSAYPIQLVNIGTSGVIVRCSQVGDIIPGPQFIAPSPQSDYYLNISVVNASSASAAGTTSYLSYNPVTGFLNIGLAGPAIDVTQEYSAVWINRKTLQRSNPVFFTALIRTCAMNVVGPKSFTVCIGLGTPYLGEYIGLNYTADNAELLVNGVNWNTINPTTGAPLAGVGPGPGGNRCPIVTAFTGPGDNSQCYIYDRQTSNPENFARGSQYSQCVYDRCITPGGGVFNPAFYTAAQLNVFATTYGLTIPAPVTQNAVLDVAGCTVSAGGTAPKGFSYCGTCLPIPASVIAGAGALAPPVTPCTAADTFTQTLTVVGNAPGYVNGVFSGITATFDSTCSSLTVFNVTY
ncbi:hypothetical protein BV898_10931 [Hypsibius exemplaris]|uniref:Uncharacterized protein n=1 Tax=Hypsibius exemplaris TaxID=2072580 RepID=A0A1W0WI92_HYPEX|nr:hypothetical protein BV898_10931 [Hypsibius exemplaris]